MFPEILRRCYKCGATLRSRAQFCQQCGAPARRAEVDDSPPPMPENQQRRASDSSLSMFSTSSASSPEPPISTGDVRRVGGEDEVKTEPRARTIGEARSFVAEAQPNQPATVSRDQEDVSLRFMLVAVVLFGAFVLVLITSLWLI